MVTQELSAAAENGAQCLGDGLWVPMGVPPGAIAAYAGSAAPAGWQLCDGSSLTTASAPNLFAAIGYTYGGSGSNFNVPDLRGRVPVGLSGTDTNFAALAQTGGEDAHVLLEAELAAHSHGGGTSGQSTDHTHPLGTTTNGSHSHSVAGDFGLRILITFTPTSIQFTNSTPSGQTISYASLDAGGDHSHTGTTTGTSNDHTHAIPSDGSNTPHNNIQPYCTLNWIIKL